jgi:hypothetical protein
MVDMNNPISAELNKQLQDYTEFLFNTGKDWDSENLEKEVFKYLDNYGHNGTLTDKLSTRFAQIWKVYNSLSKHLEADNFWDGPLNLYAKWEEVNNSKIKVITSPYYFRGMSAIAYGNIERGFMFFHQAFEGDLKEGFSPYNKDNHSPAWLFVTFNYSDPRQAALPLIKPYADWLRQLLSNYQINNRGVLSFNSLRKRILVKSRLRETTFSFTYEVFRSKYLLLYPQEFRSSQFASQLSLDILFSLCRIGEVWLKTKLRNSNHERPTLRPLLVRFFKHQNIPITNEDLITVNKIDLEKSLVFTR